MDMNKFSSVRRKSRRSFQELILMQNIEIDKLIVSDLNVRKICNLSDESFICLKESIRSVGLIEPIVVRERNEKYEIIAGQRRYHACKSLNMLEVPCEVHNLTDVQAIEISLIENLNREDIDPFDIATALKRLIDDSYSNNEIQKKDIIVEKVGKKVGLSRSMVWRYIGLLEASPEVQNMISKKELSIKTASKIASMPKEQQNEAADAIKELPSESLQEEALKEMKHSEQTPQQVVEKIFSHTDVIFEVRTPDIAVHTFRVPSDKFAVIPARARKEETTTADYLKGIIMRECCRIE